MIKFKIIQYNMQKQKNEMMISLLRKAACEEVHVLVLQEFWQNSHMNVIYCSSNCDYWSVYSSRYQSRVCLLISKMLSHDSWTVEHLQSDIVSVILQLNDIMMHVYSIYILSSDELHKIDCNFSIFRIL